MQHLNNILKLVVLATLLATTPALANNNSSRTEAGIRCIDCVIGGAQEEYWNSLRNQGWDLQKVAVFLNDCRDPNRPGQMLPNCKPDPRTPVTSEDNIPGLGRVKAYKKNEDLYSMGSGFIINECLMITNKHVVTEGNETFNVEFEPGISFPDFKTRARNASKGQIIASGNYFKDDNTTTHEDWAIVKLDRNVGREIGYLTPKFVEYNDLIERKDLTVAGIIEDNLLENVRANKPVKIQKHVNCKSGYEDLRRSSLEPREVVDTGGMITSCSSLPGTSGSPLMIKNEKRQYVAIGFMRNGYSDEHLTNWDPINSNVFIPFIKNAPDTMPQSLTEERLNQIIRANPCHR